MNQIYQIYKYTFLEILKSKLTYASIILGFVVLFLCFVSSEFTYGSPAIVALDIGLGFQTFLSLGIVIFMGLNLIADEISNRTIYMVLARPVSRVQFLFGKILGLISITFINSLIIFLFSIMAYLFLGGEINNLIINSFFLNLIESILILKIILIFSLITTKGINLICTLVILFAGHTIPVILNLNFIKQNEFFVKIINFLKFIIPSFEKLNIKNFVLYENFLPQDYLVNAYLYSFSWLIVLAIILILIFDKIEFK